MHIISRRQQIVYTAIERIATEGIRFSTEDIAREVGCSQSLIFKYFERKDDLIQECFSNVCRKAEAVVSSVKPPDTFTYESAVEYILEIWDVYMAFLDANTAYARAYVFFLAHGYVFPFQGGRSEAAIKRILGDSYDILIDRYPRINMVFCYVILMANVVVIQRSIDTRSSTPCSREYLRELMMYGISFRQDQETQTGERSFPVGPAF